MGKCRCGPYVVALRIGNAVADGELRVLQEIGKAVADFQEGRCGFCRGGCTFGNVADGLKESATTKSVRPIENHACSRGT